MSAYEHLTQDLRSKYQSILSEALCTEKLDYQRVSALSKDIQVRTRIIITVLYTSSLD